MHWTHAACAANACELYVCIGSTRTYHLNLLQPALAKAVYVLAFKVSCSPWQRQGFLVSLSSLYSCTRSSDRELLLPWCQYWSTGLGPDLRSWTQNLKLLQ